ncbi:MAG: hypothetical protein QGH83_06700 [Candidatus Pacebacteria bacterium]|nr:hypothetical protein [Candidatus Paceibacterota bacterium]
MATISNLYIDADADYSSTVTLSSVDSAGTLTVFNLTDYTATASVRKTYASSTATSFNCIIDADPTTGKVVIALTDAQTASLNRGRYVWDMMVESSGGTKTRVLQGVVTINPSVTR